MSSVSSLIDERSRYRRLKNNLNTYVDYLDKSIDKLEVAINNIKSNIMINDSNEFVKKMKDSLQNLKNDKSKIKNSVLPGIDKKIRSLGDAIERAQKEAEAAANAIM